MKKIYTFLFLVFLATTGKSQLTFSPDTGCIHIDTLGVIDTLKFTITNNGTTEELFYWKLDVGKNFPAQWKTQICDFNLCYAYNAKQQSPNQPNRLKAGETNKSFSFYLIDSFNFVFLDTVFINIYKDKTFTQLIKTIPIIIGGCYQTSSTSDPGYSSFSVYPNPINNGKFRILTDADYEDVWVRDVTGKIVGKFRKNPSNDYDVGMLTKGLYIVQLLDSQESVLPGASQKLVVE